MSAAPDPMTLAKVRLAERGLSWEDFQAGGGELGKEGRELGIPYRLSNDDKVWRRLILSLPKDKNNLQWMAGSSAKGAVLKLGDPHKAALVVIAEGESDALSAWRHLKTFGDIAVLCIPGATMVGDDLANFVGNGAHVVIATDADEAGDKCAAQVVKVLAAADVEAGMIHRARPVVPGVEKPDLRDLVEHFEANTSDPTTALDAWLRGWAEENMNGSHGASGAETDWLQPVPLGGGPGPASPLAALTPVVNSSSWEPVDLFAADAAAVEPELLRGSGGALVYPGLRHLFSGLPEAMKTWFAEIMAAEVLEDGDLVVWLNLDGMPKQQILERLRGLGVDDDTIAARFILVSPSEAPRPGEVDAHAAREPRLAVLDSLEPAGALLGLDTNGSGDVERLMRELVDPFHRVGATTVLLDHVTKDPEARGRFSIGSQRKLAAVDVHLGLKVIGQPLTRAGGQAVVEVTCHKDRMGALRRGPGGGVGRVVFNAEPGGDRVTWHVDLDTKAAGASSDGFRPTALMERVSRHLEALGQPVSARAVTDDLKGRAQDLRTALRVLVDEGFVAVEEGPKRATLHRSERPYRQADDSLSDLFVDPSGPQCVPVRPSASGTHTRSASPPLRGEALVLGRTQEVSASQRESISDDEPDATQEGPLDEEACP